MTTRTAELSRRVFVASAAAIGASIAWAGRALASQQQWRERRELFPEGVASGDPEPDSVILWTRRPFATGDRAMLTAEVALDPDFKWVVATAQAPVLADSDWTYADIQEHVAARAQGTFALWLCDQSDAGDLAAALGRWQLEPNAGHRP